MAEKFYCFYCQKEVEPKGFWFLKFCPYCKHRITDSGEGFYRICDFCGADNPVSAKTCVKCKHQLSGEDKNEIELFAKNMNPWIQTLMNVLLAIGALAFFILILYVSFYLVLAFLLFAVVYYLMLKAGFKI